MKIKLIFILLFFNLINVYSQENSTKLHNILKLALEKNLYEDTIWKALIHYKDGAFYIKNKEFLLSFEKPSLKNELIKTIELAIKKDVQICKFPARILWLERKLNIKLGTVKCNGFEEYLNKAPADSIYLVFASEDIFNPASIMGHVFFKISGKNYKGNLAEHSISFFAVIDTVNPITLLYKSFFSGMKSFFTLQPYKNILYKYLIIENRNLWEFPIESDLFSKKLLYYHFWELRFADAKYFFIGYNCATATLFVLTLLNQDIYYDINSTISPRDVIKIAYKHKIIRTGYIIPNDLSLIYLISNHNSLNENSYIKTNLDTKNWDFVKKIVKSKNIYQIKLAEIYGYFLYKEKSFTKQDLENLLSITTTESNKYELQIKDISPVETPPKTKVSLGIEKFNKKDYIKISILPISHTLSDNNKSFLYESSLKICYLNILFNNKKFILKEFTLYSTKSLVPVSIFTKKLSKSFYLGIKQNFDENTKPYISFNTAFGVGYTLRLINNMYLYTLLNFGFGYGKKELYPYYIPETGFIIYEIFNMKSNLILKVPYNYFNSEKYLTEIILQHSWHFSNKSYISLTISNLHSKNNSIYNYGFELKFLF